MAKITVDIPDRLVDSFLGYMSDGGGECGFMEAYRDIDEYIPNTHVNFDYKDNDIQIKIHDSDTGELIEC